MILSECFDESPEEFDALCFQLRDEWQPEGVMEELLVMKIAAGLWRQRRLLKAEVGEIEKNWENWNSQRDNSLKNVEIVASILPLSSSKFRVHCGHSEGVQLLLNVLEMAREDIKELGYVSDTITSALKEHFGGDNDTDVTILIMVCDQTESSVDGSNENGENEDCDDDNEDQGIANEDEMEGEKADDEQPDDSREYTAMCMSAVERAISKYTDLLESIRSKEERERRIHRFASCLPSERVSDRLLRYQTAVDRQTNDAIRQLVRLQDRRLAKATRNSEDP